MCEEEIENSNLVEEIENKGEKLLPNISKKQRFGNHLKPVLETSRRQAERIDQVSVR